MTEKRQPSPRLHVHCPDAVWMHCVDCHRNYYSIDADRACRTCGGPLSVGAARTSRVFRQSKPRSLGQFGVRDPLEEALTNAALRAAREEAQR